MTEPEAQRDFAVEVVRTLREADFEAYFAGGCVRDQLLGRVAKDYDVATSATPPQIRRLFGHHRTLAIGAAFGVITVLGPKKAGMIEVATFRRDATYSDGRHPDHVTFSSAEEDASRRDFTINGLFYDPVEDEVIDFVGGRVDLDKRVIRAIGQPRQRFTEDKLRLLRAVRFSAALDFRVEEKTRAAVAEMAHEINVVSPERIAVEMQRMLVDPGRVKAVRLLLETGLAKAMLPEIVPGDEAAQERLEHTLLLLDRLADPSFPMALVALLHELADTNGARAVCRRWKLSNHYIDRVGWLVKHWAALAEAETMLYSVLQPILVHDGIEDLLGLRDAQQPDSPEAAYCRRLLQQPPEILDPQPLLTGDDLIRHGVPRGPQYRVLLDRVRAAQLDREIHTKDEAMAMIDQILEEQ